MNAKVFTGIACLSKIPEGRITTSEKTGMMWFQVGLVVLDDPDKFGNDLIIQSRDADGDEHVPIGNAQYRGRIEFKFPKGKTVPSKLDTRNEQEETYRDYNG